MSTSMSHKVEFIKSIMKKMPMYKLQSDTDKTNCLYYCVSS